MTRLKNWSFETLVKFLKAYGFRYGHTDGSHYFYNGKILGEDRVVQVIHSKREKKCQSIKTMKLAVRNSGISKEFFREWKINNKKIHKEIIY